VVEQHYHNPTVQRSTNQSHLAEESIQPTEQKKPKKQARKRSNQKIAHTDLAGKDRSVKRMTELTNCKVTLLIYSSGGHEFFLQ